MGETTKPCPGCQREAPTYTDFAGNVKPRPFRDTNGVCRQCREELEEGRAALALKADGVAREARGLGALDGYGVGRQYGGKFHDLSCAMEELADAVTEPLPYDGEERGPRAFWTNNRNNRTSAVMPPTRLRPVLVNPLVAERLDAVDVMFRALLAEAYDYGVRVGGGALTRLAQGDTTVLEFERSTSSEVKR